MPSMADIKVAPGQADAIKGVHNVKHHIPNRKTFPETRDQKEKEKKKDTGAQKFSGSNKGRVRDDGTTGGPGSEEQRLYSGKKSEKEKEKDSQVRGSMVDVIV